MESRIRRESVEPGCVFEVCMESVASDVYVEWCLRYEGSV